MPRCSTQTSIGRAQRWRGLKMLGKYRAISAKISELAKPHPERSTGAVIGSPARVLVARAGTYRPYIHPEEKVVSPTYLTYLPVPLYGLPLPTGLLRMETKAWSTGMPRKQEPAFPSLGTQQLLENGWSSNLSLHPQSFNSKVQLYLMVGIQVGTQRQT